MTVLENVISYTNFTKLTELAHTKSYHAQARNVSDRHVTGYTVIKLDQDFTWHVETTPKTTKEFTARPGDYMVQCPGQPPRKIETWTQLKTEFHVFRNTHNKLNN